MSAFPAAVLLLLLPGICVGHWQQRDHHDRRRQPWQRWRHAAHKTPTPPHTACAANEKYSKCRAVAQCELTCEQPAPRRWCPDRWLCHPGCVCKWGYLRNEKTGKCVPRDTCTDTTPPPIVCSGNKEVVRCGDIENADVNQYCPTIEAGRDHKEAFCHFNEEKWLGGKCECRLPNRIGRRRECVPVEQCPTCAADEVYTICEADCEQSCGWPEKRQTCQAHVLTRWCKGGCVCKKGHLRDKASGKCVTKDRCPAPAPIECTNNEVPARCGELDDDNLNRLCPAKPHAAAARSHSGRAAVWGVRGKPRCTAGDERRGGRCACPMPYRIDLWRNCMPVEQCPTCDKATEVFDDCGNQCEGKCGEESHDCSYVCAEPACACKRGYRRDKASGKCVTPDKCTGIAPESGARNPINLWPRAIPYSYQ